MHAPIGLVLLAAAHLVPSFCGAGSFIENDNGVYGDDFGEEEDWDVAEDDERDDADAGEEHPKKKRKADGKGQHPWALP